MATLISMGTPRDYHNTLADVDEQQIHVPAPGEALAPSTQLAREQEIELAAYERGRQAGEIEAVRRIEAEGPKTFNQNTTIINNQPAASLPTANVVEIEPLTWPQKIAAVVGELCSLGYLAIMAAIIEEYRGGAGWSSSRNSGSGGMFNVHVITSFIGLWFACQAYTVYRMLPLHTPSRLNKALYVVCQLLAMGCFALAIACAILSQPSPNEMWSMHAWTAMLAAAVYAAHAIYSIIRVLMSQDRGIDAHTWNETSNIAHHPGSHNAHLTPEQRRDHATQLPTVYTAAPTGTSWWGRKRALGANSGNAPVWSEQTHTADRFFLVPRAKWATVSLIGLVCSVLIGLGAWQQLLASGQNQWAQGGAPNADGPLDYTSTESRLFSVLGLLTLAGVMCLAYVAMPPRTLVARGNVAEGALMQQQQRTSISTAETAPTTQMYEQRRGVEVV